MTARYKMDDLLAHIRARLGIDEETNLFYGNIDGIRTEFKKLSEEQLMLRTECMELELRPGYVNEDHNKLIHMLEPVDTVYKEFNLDHPVKIISGFLSEDIDKTKKPTSFPFNFVLKVYKSFHDIEDTADRFQMNYEGSVLELESMSEDEIVIRWDGGEVFARSFLPYSDKLLAQNSEYFYENMTLSNYSKVAVLYRAHADEQTDRDGLLAALKLLLSYYHGLLIRIELPTVMEIVERLAYRQNDVEIDNIRYAVYLEPGSMM
ncbi:hypothetical protein [Paenibacillus sp. NPDC057967]|uniref:hypothetical protein n=1 Tax=Paenibacillus sp. NPDC057967 TaxID=3346293 RepID=UPI0036DE54DF